MPVLVKPATSTAVLTERIFHILVEAGVCPDGVLNLVAGSPGDLVDHLGPQDVLAFTGSADTGAWIRSRPAIVNAGVRVNVDVNIIIMLLMSNLFSFDLIQLIYNNYQ